MQLFGFLKRKNAPPPSLDDVDLHIRRIPGAIELATGYPRINWPVVHHAAEAYANHPDFKQIWIELCVQWLGVLAEHLGNDYTVYESTSLVAISNQGMTETRRVLMLGDDLYLRLQSLAGTTRIKQDLGKHAVIALRTAAEYYDYICHFYPDEQRTFATSGGVHISTGYRHTVINGPLASAGRTLAHELAHDMVSGRGLPLWLNEGFAQFAEDLVPGYRSPMLNRREAELHRRYWSWFGTNHFWNGTGFGKVGSQRLCYQLANIVFRNLAAHPARGRQLGKFLQEAKADDHGAAASLDCFRVPLGSLLGEFLGEGDWEPTKS